ncbi:hypothetical protein OG466_35450 [Streptomyces sp. NBC_01240]|nr:hypothetical protein OG466_35450 [Streptomyces sp. NBC_01240]
MSVISTRTNTVTATIAVGDHPIGLSVTPDNRRVYVSDFSTGTVSVISTRTNTVTAGVAAGLFPVGVAASWDKRHVYSPTPVTARSP